MARLFASASSQRIDIGGGQMASQAMTYGTTAVITRRSSIPGGAFSGLWAFGVGQLANASSFEIDTSNNLYISYDGTTNARYTTTAYTSTTNWYLFAFSKGTGSVLPRAHVYDYTAGTWAHGNGDVAIGDGSSTAGSTFTVGSFGTLGDFYDGDIAAVGFWRTWNPTDTEFESLGLPFSRMAWLYAGARADKTWVTFYDQDATTTNVIDYYGGGVQSAASATPPSISTTSVPNFGWGGGIILPNPSSAVVVTYSPNDSRYIYRPALQLAATW